MPTWLTAQSAPWRTGLPGATEPQLVAQLGHEVHSAAFSPDGSRVLTGGSGSAILWDAETAAELRRFTGGRGTIGSVAFSPDGRQILTSGSDSIVFLWDAATGAELRRLRHEGPVSAAAFSPDGDQVLTGSDSTITIWRPADRGDPQRVRANSLISSLSVSSDSRHFVTGHTDATARLWRLADGQELRRFVGHEHRVIDVSLSADGAEVLTSSRDGTARLWDARTGAELQRFDAAVGLWGREYRAGAEDAKIHDVQSVELSPQADRVLTASEAGVRVWDRETGAELRRLGSSRSWEDTDQALFSPNGRHVLIVSKGVARLVDVQTGTEQRRFDGVAASASAFAISSTGRYALTAGAEGIARLWDLQLGAELRRFRGNAGRIISVGVSPDGGRMLTGGDSATILWDLHSGTELRRFAAERARVAFSPDQRVVATATPDRVWLWDAATGEELFRLGDAPVRRGPLMLYLSRVNSVAFSPDGHHLLTGHSDSTVRLWDVRLGVELRRYEGHSGEVRSVAFSPDGSRVLSGGYDKRAFVWSTRTGRELMRLEGHQSWILQVGFLGDGTRMVTATATGTRLWDAQTGRELRRLEAGVGAFSLDGRYALTAGPRSGISTLWDARAGRPLARLISFKDGSWAVLSTDGRFDSPDLERVEGLHWVMPDDPFTPLSIEVFMRDYYEPRLLPRLLAGEHFPELGALGSRNRVQPHVRVAEVAALPGGTATVSIEVEPAARHFARGADSVLVRSGAADLRLFRDGQLVGYVDGPLDVSSDHVARFTFEGVRLPRTGVDSVTFSAYAFNEDFTSADGSEWIGRVKSATKYRSIAIPDGLEPRKGRAYLVTIGVDAYQSPVWNLRFAADDARVLGTELSQRFAGSGAFEEVVTVPLISDQEPVGSTVATKSAIRAVLDLLAGRDVSPETRALIPNADEIRPARPEDLVLISFSGHGYTDQQGIFYMLPSDIGAGVGKQVTRELLARTVSSDDLTAWLRDVDAGEMVLIVDACHSAAAVEGAGFKPGPMGSRGLGQLAYDKGMRVLAASQAEDVALESDVLRQGLLTYALVQDGLKADQADHEPADGRITLSEWLAYATERVPTLYEEVLSGDVQTFGRGFPKPKAEAAEDPSFQRPALFDFRKGQRPVLLEGARPGPGTP